MTTHAEILAELERYEGGMFVPFYGETSPNFRLTLTKNGWYYLTPTGQILGGWNGGKDVYAKDAHAHIERAAFRAVMHWFYKKHPYHKLFIDPDGVGYNHGHESEQTTYISRAPDEPAMWLSAMKYINGEKS